MDFELKTLTRARICNEKCDALIVLIPQDLNSDDDPLSALSALAIKSGDLEIKAGRLLSAYRTPGIAAIRIVLVGAGDGSPKNIRTAVNAAFGALKTSNAQRAILCLSTLNNLQPDAVRAAVVACSEAVYSYNTTKSKSKATPAKLQRVVVGVSDAATARAGFDKGIALVKGLAIAKEWANRPANYATPTLLAGAARELAESRNIEVEILGPKEVAKLGMGSFMAVAQGSAEPLRFIILRYNGAAKAMAPVVLIGKGITFDTGGISLKPGSEMDEMKFDMCGAASVLGIFRALAELQPALNVVGLIPASENMPDGRAVKPGDVVTSMSGQTIEILNTDAEGRLVLCDALTYAERFKPKAVVDIATLTGACVVALGGVRSALFSTDEQLAVALQAAGESSLDLCWRMPLDEEYAEGLKTNFADVANIAGRAAGAVTAAKFLQRFASRFPWAHLDIAGTAWKGGTAKGATGRPVALLLDYLLSQIPSAVPGKAPAKAKLLKSKAATKTRA
ncbi:leucyl aminopeptidase [Polaromonas sp.]|uniref:leucyl aminopeptidase n=1 Tax=Polaromonas sp. TaxID=1869339 RepID=UPI001798A1B1|nr:leucyl aminopeptidase [Polaromonas sp.]NMM04769.1 leucyl aminopeptidase [Polaromonas sp.]